MTLLVAATERELCGLEGLVCGIGPVEAAAATARALAQVRPNALLHVGIAGGRGIAPPTLVLGSEAVYCDLGDLGATMPGRPRGAGSRGCLAALRAALPGRARCSPIGTSGAGRRHGDGAAASRRWRASPSCARPRSSRACPRSSCAPISNDVGRAGPRRAGDSTDALDALAAAMPRLLSALAMSGDRRCRRRFRPRRGRSASSSPSRSASTATTSGACCRSGSRSPLIDQLSAGQQTRTQALILLAARARSSASPTCSRA